VAQVGFFLILVLKKGNTDGRPAMSPSDDPYDASDRTRLLQGTATLEDGSRRLQDSQRIALETEEVGADILRSLGRQREQIVNARVTVGRVHWKILVHRIDDDAAGFGGRINCEGEWDAEGDDSTVCHVLVLSIERNKLLSRWI
jgi:hypothetical protein